MAEATSSGADKHSRIAAGSATIRDEMTMTPSPGCRFEMRHFAFVARRSIAVLLAAALAGCAPFPQRAGVPTQWLASPSHDERRPNLIVLHHTGSDSVERALTTLTTRAREVSTHYLVGRDGTIWQLVDERARAWHAGDSYWAGMTDLNSASIGIELDNNGYEPFAEAQMQALLALLNDITTRYHMPRTHVLGHGDIAPARKVDPSRYFPWQRLAREGFGLWCDPPYPPASADATLLLAALGYDMRDPRAAVAAFRRHFGRDDSDSLTADDAALLQCLVRLRTGITF